MKPRLLITNFNAVITLLALIFLTNCAHLPKEQSLYERIGGTAVLTKVVNETIDKTSTDPAIKRSFDGIKLSTLKKSVVNQLCVLTNGPCEYDGETMKKAHADAKITTAEFELFVQVFRDALDHQGVGTREKNELLKILAPMKRDIVSTP